MLGRVNGPNRDLHLAFTVDVANPINILCDMISKLQNEDLAITIPGFMIR